MSDWADEKATAIAVAQAEETRMPVLNYPGAAVAAALREAEKRGRRKVAARMTSIFEDEGRGQATVTLKPRMIQRLDELQATTGVMSRSDVIRNALIVYELYVKARQKKSHRDLSEEGRDV